MRRHNQRNTFDTWGGKDEFHSGAFVLVGRRGMQTTTSYQPPHLLCALLLGSQFSPSNEPYSCFSSVKSLQSPYDTWYTSYTSEVWKQNFTHRQFASQNPIFNITHIGK